MKKNNIVFVPIPESLQKQPARFPSGGSGAGGAAAKAVADGGFSIDPDIPVPVEIPEGLESINLKELSWEMILSGMLRVIEAGEARQDQLDYYRNFVLALRPDILQEFTEAAIIKAQNGDFEMALEIFDILLALFPQKSRVSATLAMNRALAMEQKAARLELLGSVKAEAALADAENAYRELLEAEPPLEEACYNGGLFFLSQKKFAQAEDCFSRYLEVVKQAAQDAGPDAPAQDAVGGANSGEKKKRARGIIKEIREKGLNDENFRTAYGLIQQGKKEESLPYIQAFLEQYPKVWNGWFLLGWALRLSERWADGAAAFRKAIELGGSKSDTRNELAICLMETGDLPGARRELEAALRDDPENIKIISNLGVLAQKSGRRQEAAAFFNTVFELSGSEPQHL